MSSRWLLLLALVACKGGGKEKASPTTAAPTLDIPACGQALAKANAAPLAKRAQIILDGCRVCGDDWKPVLAWNLEPAHGGPRAEQLQKVLESCNAFCTGDAKMKFMAGVDKARGQPNDTPWRRLADTCKESVDAASDHRFMSAPYFALDRIARAVGREPGMKAELDRVELPLPALSIAGTGVVLPEADVPAGSSSERPVITVLGDQIFVGKLPRAHLGPAGVTLDLGDPPYPGTELKPADLAAALKGVVASEHDGITLLAPYAMPAEKLVPIVAATAGVARLYLGAASKESPPGWQVPEPIPYELQVAEGGIKVTAEMTVQNLVNEINARRSGTLQRQ